MGTRPKNSRRGPSSRRPLPGNGWPRGAAAAWAAVQLALIVVGVAVGLAGLAVALIGAAHLIGVAFSISQGWALLMRAGAALVAGAGIAASAASQVGRSFDSFRRSREE